MTAGDLGGSSAGAGSDEHRWLERLVAALEARSGAGVGAGAAWQEEVLDIARDVAHATVRRNAPLAAFIIGHYTCRRMAEGVPLATALGEAAAVVSELT